MPRSRDLLAAREAFARQRWSEACTLFVAADAEERLSPEDLEQLATAEFLIGDDAASLDARTRAHGAFLERGDNRAAARSAFWLGFTMFEKPQQRAQASGWMARARRLLDEVKEPCIEEGWLLCASGRQSAFTQDFTAAYDAFTRAAALGAQFGDRDLVAMARHGQGRSLVLMNRAAEGLALFDEVMVSVTGGETGPIVSGAVYCSVISGAARDARRRRTSCARRRSRSRRHERRVVYGISPRLSWIDLPVFDPDGEPQHEAGILPSQPGLYFVGLHFLYALSSGMIHGVGRDAERIARSVARRGYPLRRSM